MIWNLANSSSELINESTKLDSYFIKSDGYKDVVVDITSALDDTRATKYDAANWSDLTVEQLEQEIPYFDGSMSANTDLTETSDIAVESVGKNLLGCRIVDGYSWSIAGEKLANPGYVAFDDFVRVLPNTTYTLSKDGTAFPMTVRYYDIEKTNLSSSVGSVSTFATPEKCAYIVAYELHTYSAEENFQLEKGSVATDYEPYVSDTIYLPSGIDLLSINNVTNEYNPRTGILTRRVEKETVAVSSNAATTSKAGTGACKLFDANGITYDGTISGTAVTVTAANGAYTILYELSEAETVYYYPQEIICRENGTLYVHTDRVTDVSFYSDAIYIFDESKPIASLLEVNRVDLATGRLVPVDTDDCTVAADGLSFTVTGAEVSDFYDFAYETDASIQDPRILVNLTLPASMGAQVTSIGESMTGIKTSSNEMASRLGALGRIVVESGVAERDIPAVNIENIIHGGVTQIPTVEIYGTTLVNLLGAYGNFEVDTNADGLADGWTNDAALSAVANAIDTSNEIFGSNCQKITLSADGEGGNYAEITVAAGEALFVAGYIKAGDTDTTGELYVDWRDNTDTQISTDSVGTHATTTTTRKSAVLTAPANTVKARIYITVAGVSGKLAYFDGIEAIDLTELGALDPVRQAKYGVANWADLTEAQLEAEIPYFDSVMSVNVEDGTASELVVENRGKNLVSTNNLYNYDGGSIDISIPYLLPYIKEYDCFLGVRYNLTYIVGGYVDLIEKLSNSIIINISHPSYTVAYFSKCKPSTTYTISTNWSFTTNYIRELDNSGNSITTHSFSQNISFTTSSNAQYLIIIPYPASSGTFEISNPQLEEGSVATDYVPPRTDSITIPDTVELHGYNGVFNYIDSNGNFVKNWERDDKTTDAAGAFSLSGYASGSKVICRNKTNGEVEVLDAAASVTTSWTEEDIEVVYRMEESAESSVSIPDSLMLYTGQNNILFPDAKAPAAFNTHIRGQGSIVWDLITMLNSLEARIASLES